MGNQTISEFKEQDPTTSARQIDREQNCIIFQNDLGQEFEKYVVANDGSSGFQNSYEFRSKNRHVELVDVLYASPQKNHFGCAEKAKYDVVTERIPYRLAHLPTQKPINSFIILKTALNGFKDIYKYHGLMSVKDKMIGVNSKNKVKVWLNPNFSLNVPQEKPFSLQNLQSKDHQREMVNNIFDLISSKTQQNSLWIDFFHRKELQDPRSFNQALHIVDNFLQNNNIKLNEQLKNPFNKIYYDHNFGQKSQISNLTNLTRQQHLKQQSFKLNAGAGLNTGRSSNAFYPITHMQQKVHPSQLVRNQYVVRSQLPINNTIDMNNLNQIPKKKPFEEMERNFHFPNRRIQISNSLDRPFTSVNSMIIKKPNFTHVEPHQINQVFKPMIKFGHNNQPLQQFQSPQIVQRIAPVPHFNEVRYQTITVPQKMVTTIPNSQQIPRTISSNNVQKQKTEINKTIVTNQASNQKNKQVYDMNVINSIENTQSVDVRKEEKHSDSFIDQSNDKLNIVILKENQINIQAVNQEGSKPLIASNQQLQKCSNKMELLQQPNYQIQVHQVASQRSIGDISQQQLVRSIKQQKSFEIYQNRPNMTEQVLKNSNKVEVPAYKLTTSLNDNKEYADRLKQNQDFKSLQQFKTVVNASLVDTKQIKRQSQVSYDRKRWSRDTKNQSISYRQMRRLLLQATSKD